MPRMGRAPACCVAALVAGALAAACESEDTLLVVDLVPNPEVNTREQVRQFVNSLDLVLDAEGGFAGLDAGEGETWGQYLVTDEDEDGTLELLLTRPGSQALEPFALSPGQQGDRVITISARGRDQDQNVAALGASRGQFRQGERSPVEVPFNLLPDFRPLRVVSMSPPDGATGVEPPVLSLTLELGGHVAEDQVEGNVTIRLESYGYDIEELDFDVSYENTGLGWVTTIRLAECVLLSGAYTVIVDTAVCTRTGQCLDQDLGLEGAQPFEGRFAVAGPPESPSGLGCGLPESMALSCPETCPADSYCSEGECLSIEMVPMGPEGGPEPECDPALCAPPEHVCNDRTCSHDCRFFGGLCVDPTRRCDESTGICEILP